MNGKQIHHIINDHYKKLKNAIKKIAGDFDVEAMHQFRVAYKRLRAFLRMLPAEGGTAGAIKISKEIKKYYHISGSIRDLQLQQQRVAEATLHDPGKSVAYQDLLQEKIDNLKPELAGIFLEKPVAKSKMKSAGSVPDAFTVGSFRDFVQQKWAAVCAIIITGDFADDHLHTIRKHLKDVFYTLKIYEKFEDDPLSPGEWDGKDQQYVEALLEQLGNFQDTCVAIDLLKPYQIRGLQKYDRTLLTRIKNKLLKEKAEIKKLLVKKLKTDIAFQ